MKSAHTTATPEHIAEQLRNRLLALDFPTFARCICRLMDALDYEDAHLAGRREWKGYNRPGGGGYDLEATLLGGLAPRRVIAQIKQYNSLAVHQRSVDELRGACLRAGATEGLLVTTSAFSEVVRKSAALLPDPMGALVAPVRLMDGEELIGHLIRHRLGVRERGLGRVRRLDIDEAFFRNIAAPSAPPASRQSSSPRIVRLTVQISSPHISSDIHLKMWKRGSQNRPAEREQKGRL